MICLTHTFSPPLTQVLLFYCQFFLDTKATKCFTWLLQQFQIVREQKIITTIAKSRQRIALFVKFIATPVAKYTQKENTKHVHKQFRIAVISKILMITCFRFPSTVPM